MRIKIIDAAKLLTDECHRAAKHWWTPETLENPMCFAQKLCLVHSEISEAMEGDRKSLMDDKLPHRTMREVELADALIRIFDMAGAFKLDVAGAMVEKMAYNAQREDHKLENRAKVGGKAY